MDRLTERMGSVPNLTITWSVSIGTMLNFDGDGDGHSNGDGTCKQALTQHIKYGHLTMVFFPQELHLNLCNFKMTRLHTNTRFSK